MEYTSGSLRLAKPQLSDVPDITRMNPNWDKIDENISGFNNKFNVLSTQSILPKQDLTNSNNMLQIRTPGVYRVFNRVPSNFIPGYSEGYFSILVYENNQYCVQEATCFNTGRTFKQLINSLSGEVFKSWYEIATTDKTEISLTPQAGYEIISQNNYKINNILHINTNIRKTDSSRFIGGQLINGIILPLNVFATTLNISCSYGGHFKIGGSAVAYDTNVTITPASDCDAIRVSGEVVL